MHNTSNPALTAYNAKRENASVSSYYIMLDVFFFLMGAKFKLNLNLKYMEKKYEPIQLLCALGLVENLRNT